jgi:hypothetical protein
MYNSQDEKAGEISVVYVQKQLKVTIIKKQQQKKGCPVRSVVCGQEADDLLITGRF